MIGLFFTLVGIVVIGIGLPMKIAVMFSKKKTDD